MAPNGSWSATSGPTAGTLRTLHLAISGMTCEHCRLHVAEALTAVDGVSSATVDLKRGTATITLLTAVTTDAELLAAVDGAGYQASVDEGPDEGP